MKCSFKLYHFTCIIICIHTYIALVNTCTIIICAISYMKYICMLLIKRKSIGSLANRMHIYIRYACVNAFYKKVFDNIS